MSWLAAARKRVLPRLASSAADLRLRQRLVGLDQRLGALAHAPFQGFVGAGERPFALDALRDVGRGHHDAAVRHRTGAHFEHGSRRLERLLDVASRRTNWSSRSATMVSGRPRP